MRTARCVIEQVSVLKDIIAGEWMLADEDLSVKLMWKSRTQFSTVEVSIT